MPTPEELAEQLRRLKASDVVLSLIPTLAQVAWAKLDAQSRDLIEARVAIDAIRALVPVLDGVAPPEVTARPAAARDEPAARVCVRRRRRVE